MPEIKQIEEEVKEAKAEVAEIGAGVRSLAEIDTALAPVIDTGAGDILATAAGVDAGIGGLQDWVKDYVTRTLEQRQQLAQQQQKGILDIIRRRGEVREEMPPMAEALRTATAEAYEMYGLTPEVGQQVMGLIGQMTTYNQQAADLEAQTQLGLVNIEQRLLGRPGAIVRGEQGLYQRQQNIKIAAKAAQAGAIAQQVQMMRGLMSDAQTTAGQIVNAMMYDQTQRLADLDWAKDTYTDLYNIMSQEEQLAWNRTYQIISDEKASQEKDYYAKLDMRMRAGEQGVTMSSTLDMPLDEWTKEYSERVAAIPERITAPTTKEIGGRLYQWNTETGTWELAPGVPGVEITGEEPAPYMKSMAQRYLTASPEEQERFIPSAPYQQADFWNEVDWLQAQTGELAPTQTRGEMEAEFLADKEAGMPQDSAIDLYGTDLGEDWIKAQYKAPTSFWKTALGWATLPYTAPTKLIGKLIKR